ncbi:MAG TPA: inositol monophosphatase family protein [Beijerinckiaceae bacterium]|nr:inositol monophosphatase family protein [Beijerinckiaceae bacterium]
MIRTPLMNVMTAAALKAGKSLRKDFAELPSLKVSRKGPGDFVSQADKRAEDILYRELDRARPGYCFRMEESGTVEGPDKTHVWHVDPLDGTTNFLHGFPNFAVSIGLEREGQLVAGVVYNPATDDMYIAEKGQGAFHNNHRMRVSACIEPLDALVACGIPHAGKAYGETFRKELTAVMGKVGGVRRFGACALDVAAVANGQFEGFWERGLNSWDMAGAIVLVREAGGFVSDIRGNGDMLADGSLIVGNESMFALLKSLVSGID